MARPSKSKKSKKLPSSQGKAETETICFTIMPFGGWFDTYYEQIFLPAIESSGLVARRADDLYRPSAIVHDIWEITKKAKIVLAELSGRNPNVFYELGLAHALAKPAILVTQTVEDVPFDLRALRVIVYDRNEPNWGDVLKTAIESSIREILTSPVKSVLPSFLQVDDSHKPSVTTTEKELISLRQDVDLLKREAATAKGFRTPLYSITATPFSDLATAKRVWSDLGAISALTPIGITGHTPSRIEEPTKGSDQTADKSDVTEQSP